MKLSYIIREELQDYITIESSQIREAIRYSLENLDLKDMVTEAIQSCIAEQVEDTVIEIIEDTVSDLIKTQFD